MTINSMETLNRSSKDENGEFGLPENIRLTLLSLVTQRMIELRHQPDDDDFTSREMAQSSTAADWLLKAKEP